MLPAHIFVLFKDSEPASSYGTASVEGKTPVDIPPPPNVQSVRFPLGSSRCDDACSGTSCHVLLFGFLMFMLVFFNMGTNGFQPIALVHK